MTQILNKVINKEVTRYIANKKFNIKTLKTSLMVNWLYFLRWKQKLHYAVEKCCSIVEKESRGCC